MTKRCEHVGCPRTAAEKVEVEPVRVMQQVALAARDVVQIEHDLKLLAREVVPQDLEAKPEDAQHSTNGPASAGDTADQDRKLEDRAVQRPERKTTLTKPTA